MRTQASICEQGCGEVATVYAMDPLPGGWAGRYCEPCAGRLKFVVTDRLRAHEVEPPAARKGPRTKPLGATAMVHDARARCPQ